MVYVYVTPCIVNRRVAKRNIASVGEYLHLYVRIQYLLVCSRDSDQESAEVLTYVLLFGQESIL